MKIIFLFVPFLLSVNIFAQKLPEIEFTGRPYVLTENGELENLERADAQVDIKVKALGYGGSETYYTVFSPASSINFAKNNLPKIIIKLEGNVDPAEVVVLSKAIVKKERRRFLQGSNSLVGKARNISDSFISLDFKKLEEGVYQIMLPENMEAGEYGFMPVINNGKSLLGNSMVKINCFSVE